MRQLILHIGMPKCGSTFLQRVMEQNRNRLRTYGISYPEDRRSPHPGNGGPLHLLDETRIEVYLASSMHTLLLSHENLLRRSQRGAHLPDLAARMGLQVKIVVFLRPYSEFILGAYSQRMKERFETYLAARTPYEGNNFKGFAQDFFDRYNLAERLRCWQSYFPESPLIIRPHLKIRSTMQDLLGPEVDLDWEVPPELVNPSLRAQDCDRLAAAIRDPEVSEDQVRMMLETAMAATGGTDTGRCADRINWLEELHAARNAQILQDFGYDNRLPSAAGKRPDGVPRL